MYWKKSQRGAKGAKTEINPPGADLLTSKLNQNEIFKSKEAQLSVERADKLVLIYYNAALLDNTDYNDYLADFEFV